MVLTETEMTRLWLLRKGYEPLRSDCRISRSDGADLLQAARTECRLWYEDLLLHGPLDALEIDDIKDRDDFLISATLLNSSIVTLPPDCIRVAAVKLRSWHAPAEIVPGDSPLGRLQYAAYASAGPVSPVAVLLPGNRLELFSNTYENSDTLEYLLCVLRPAPDEEGAPLYRFRPSALSLL